MDSFFVVEQEDDTGIVVYLKSVRACYFFSHGLEERYVQIRSICPILTNCMLDDFLIALMWLAAGSYHLFDKLFSILRTIGKAIFHPILRLFFENKDFLFFH